MQDLKDRLTISNSLEDRAEWPKVRELINSDQIPVARVVEIYAEFPAFAAWMAEQRKV